MARSQAAVAKERFAVRSNLDGDEIRIRAVCPPFIVPMLVVALALAALIGVGSLYELARKFDGFAAAWLVVWIVCWACASPMFAWLIAGSETLRTTGTDLEVTYRLLGVRRRQFYEGSHIRGLTVADTQSSQDRVSSAAPIFFTARSGSVRFEYDARTHYVAAGLTEVEAGHIVDLLARRLPSTATTGGDARPNG